MATTKLSLDLDYKDLVAISNSLNEVCNGLPQDDFENRVGIPREDALKLLKKLHHTLDKYPYNTSRPENTSH